MTKETISDSKTGLVRDRRIARIWRKAAKQLLTSNIRHYTMVLDLRHVIPSAEFSSGGGTSRNKGEAGTPVPPVATRMVSRPTFAMSIFLTCSSL